MKVLLIISSLGPSGAAKQLALLAPGLSRQKFEAQIVVLGQYGPFAGPLQEAGLPVHVLGWKRLFDLTGLLRLRRLVQELKPDVLHVWDFRALARVCLALGHRAGKPSSRLVISGRLGPHEMQARRLTGWLLSRADRVVVSGAAEAAACCRLYARPGAITVVPPAVALCKAALGPEGDLRRQLGLPPGSRLVACVGPFEPHKHKSYHDALWAFNILTYLYDDLGIVLLGAGPDQQRLEQIARQANLPRVYFREMPGKVADLLTQADVVWVPNQAAGGRNVALEAMAAGKPVVATRLPGLAEIIADGREGFLVLPGDKVALARQTRFLLDDPALRRRLGEAGRAQALRQFSVSELCDRFSNLYESAAA
jgi:glycosyltransferase involved in cell wall biosynthesis